MRIGKLARSAECRMHKQYQKFIIFGILIVFQIETILKIRQFSNFKN